MVNLPDSGDACVRDDPAAGTDEDRVFVTDLFGGNLKNSSVTAAAGSGPGRNFVRVLQDSPGIASSPSTETSVTFLLFLGFQSSGPLLVFVAPRGAMFREADRSNWTTRKDFRKVCEYDQRAWS